MIHISVAHNVCLLWLVRQRRYIEQIRRALGLRAALRALLSWLSPLHAICRCAVVGGYEEWNR